LVIAIKSIIYIIILWSFSLHLGAKTQGDSIHHPLSSHILFTQNKGQWHQKVLYQGKFKGGKVFLEQTGFTYLFSPKAGLGSLHHKLNRPSGFDTSLIFHTIKMEFLKANSNTEKQELDSNAFYENYFIGKDAKQWASHVKSYKEIWYKNLYPQVDVKTLSDKNNFRFDLVLNPGAEVNDIALKFTGQNSLRIEQGNLIMSTEVGDVLLKNPYAYQNINGKEIKIKCRYVLSGEIVTFKLEEYYDKRYPLIIDPTLVFATYTGSLSDNFGMTATYDVAGNAYTAGVCYGSQYPITTGAFQINFAGPSSTLNPGMDISISKFNPSGSSLLYSTYLGGASNEEPQSIVVDNNNELVVFGRTNSSNFPTTVGSFQTTLAGGFDIILTKFNANGTGLVASSYMGGIANDNVNGTIPLFGLHYNYCDDLRGGVIIDEANNIYFGSCTNSNNFPVTAGCMQPVLNGNQDAVIVKFDPNITSPIYSTYFGGTAEDAIYSVALNSNDQLYITGGTASTNFLTTPGSVHSAALGGIDGFLSLLSANGNSILASTYLGTPAYDQSYFIQLDKQNRVYAFGQTEGAYPVSAGVYSNPNSGQFIHCFNSNLTSTFFSTVVGTGDGFPDIVPSAFLVDVCGNIYLSGWGGDLFGNNEPQSATFGLPITANAFTSNTDGSDFYFMVLNKDALSLQYATFFGGALSLEHVDGGTSRFDKSGIIYQAICESCGGHDDMPTTPGAWSTQNGSTNCNNAVVKFTFNQNLVVAQLATNPISLSGCAPFTVNFINHSVNGVNYTWSFGDGNFSTLFEPAHTYTLAGTYQVRLVSNNNATCNQFDTTYISVQVFPPLILTPIPAVNICFGDSVSLNLNAPVGSTYTWTPNVFINNVTIQQPKVSPPIDTMYKVTVTKNGCTAYDSVEVFVFKNNTKIVFDSSHICLDDTVKLHANHINSSYQWSSGETSQSINVLTHGWYFLTTLDANGCKAIDSVKVDSLHRLPINSYTMAICKMEELQLLAPSGNYTYWWTPFYKINSPSSFNPFVSPEVNTTYSLSLYNGTCKSEATYSVTVFPIPSFTVTPKISEILPGDFVTISSSSDTISTWYPNYNLSCTSCTQTIAAPEVNTVYYAIVTNKYGCKKMDSVKVNVTPTIYIPNCFTPNQDLVNDVFKPEFSGYVEIELMIFDRWGEMIFKTSELYGGWNGKKKEVNCELGVYTYKLTAKDYKNKTIEKVGHVTLLR
jgi:gliding motility-associated-like protein